MNGGEIRYDKTPFSASSRWWVFLTSFFILMFLYLLCFNVVTQMVESDRARLLISSCLQNMIGFALPVWIAWRLTSLHPASEMGLAVRPSFKALAGVIILYVLAYPALNQIIYWNSIIAFPDFLKDLEETFRNWEEASNKSAMLLLDVNSVWGMLVNLIVIGIITGFGEECLFRGGLMQMMRGSGCNKILAIWISAFIFSAVHFQFFGFIPRLILGAWFGYMLLWTGSLWTAIFAHALNNGMVVFVSWFSKNQYLGFNADEIGVVTAGIPWPFLASISITAAFLILFRKYFFSPVNQHY